MMPKVYVFSGLGVDKRVFDGIDFASSDVEFIDWIKPLKNERINEYASRISQKITEKEVILIGVSFGGMMAVEVSKIVKVKKLILIASAKNRRELPKIYRILGKLRLNKMVPSMLFKWQNSVTNWFFGLKIKKDKTLLRNILKDTDSRFLRWAINEIVNWKNTMIPENCIHIHGNKDRIIPISNCKVDYVINGGGHFMTVSCSDEIERIIKEECEIR